MAQPMVFQKIAILFQIKFLNFWKYLTSQKAKGHVSALRNWTIPSWVINAAVISSQATSQIKVTLITQEGLVQFLSAKTCPSAFGLL